MSHLRSEGRSFVLRRNQEQPALGQNARITQVAGQPTQILAALDLTKGALSQEYLAELVGSERLTALWVLNLVHRMKKVPLGKEHDVVWQSLQSALLRKLVGTLFDDGFCEQLANEAQSAFGERPSGSGIDLLGQVSLLALRHRYPEYETLIRQPHWQGRVDDYIGALSSADVPLAAKRGREPWKPEDAVATRVLGTNRMNLSGGAYAGYESLIVIESSSKNTPLEIRFRVHPLEEELRTLIRAQELGAGRKFKHEGKECWHLPLDELLPIIVKKGYTVEELNRIILIGKARGSYDVGQMGRERVLYCVPLDPEELKAQLRAKLHDLIQEIQEYKTLPDYVSIFDDHRMAQEIDAVEDDADYERLLLRLNREFKANHQRLPAYFGRGQERLRNARNTISRLQGQLIGSRDVAQLSVPMARSQWREAFERYIVPNLQREGDDLRVECKSALEQADATITKYIHSQARLPAANLALVLEGFAAASALEATQTELVDRTRQWLTRVTELNHWFRLLRAASDPLYERLLELKRDEAHRAKGDELLSAFDGVSQHIEDHIGLRNVMGLAAYAQFAQDIKEIEERRQEYLGTLKSSFDLCKSRVNALLEKAKLDERVNIVFNPAAVSGCYTQLYADGAKAIREVGCGRALREIADQGRDLQYARDILKAISIEEATSLLKTLEENRAKTDALQEQATEAWLRQLVENWPEAEIEQVVATMDAALVAVRTVRQKVNEISRPDAPQEGRAAWLHAALPATGQMDLKELILKTMDEVQDPSSALETSLDALGELFRRNCVHINVSQRTR